ncbi:hypothetical protein [Vibrio sp. MACH09]|uniref:hypothetical protein n=1 Tax=Vibrio sp. MACH09 TaxID=3025122 RepID=UPI00295ECDCB|nr:hypothetical protein [Vibrio sp. MACH09]
MKRNSTLIEVTESTATTLDYLISVFATNENTKKIYSVIKRLGAMSDYVTLYDVMEHVEINKTAVRKRFIELKENDLVTIKSAKDVFPDAPPRLEIYTFKSLGDLPNLDHSRKKLVNGRKSALIAQENLQKNEVYTPASYREKFRNSDQGYQLAVNNEVRNMFAPGNEVISRKEVIVRGHDGRTHKNFAESIYGIVNDEDSQLIEILMNATIQYLINLPPHRQTELNDSKRIPLWMDDLLAAKNLDDTAQNRLKISLSLLRIQKTLYKYHVNSKQMQKEIADQLGEMTDTFQFLQNMKVMSKKYEGRFSDDMFNQNQDMSVEATIHRDWGDELPFTCVFVQWATDFYKKNFSRKIFFGQNILAQQVPSTLYRIYKDLRVDYYRKSPVFFNHLNSVSDLTLIDLVQFTWPTENEPNKLVEKVLIDIKKCARSFDLINISDNDDGSSTAIVELFGIRLCFAIPNLKKHQLAANRYTKIDITINEQQLVTQAGAVYNPVKANNTPTLPPLFMLYWRPIIIRLKKHVGCYLQQQKHSKNS